MSHSENSVAFEFAEPTGFDFLVVSDSAKEIVWELKPLTMEPTQIIEAEMFGIHIGADAEVLIEQVLKEPHGVDKDENPRVTRVVYGETPHGYREVRKAIPLQSNEEYCVFVFGDGFDKTVEYFCA